MPALTELTLRHVPGTEQWVVDNPFIWQIDKLGQSPAYIRVPSGYQTDLASVPRFFWRVFHPAQHPEASVPHDAIYSGATLTLRIFTRREADDLFLDILTEMGASWFKRRSAWLAVRMFGGARWRKR